jgi:hypothetical protein
MRRITKHLLHLLAGPPTSSALSAPTARDLAAHQQCRIKDTTQLRNGSFISLSSELVHVVACSPYIQGRDKAHRGACHLSAKALLSAGRRPRKGGRVPEGNARESWAEAAMGLATRGFLGQDGLE